MKRGAPLSRSVPLKRTGRLRSVSAEPKVKAPKPRSPRGSVAEAVRMVLAAECTVAQAARITGANPDSVEARAWEEAKRLVMERDSHTCVATGGRAVDVHHRRPRGMGGTADPRIAFGMANLVSLTRAAHDLAHDNSDPVMAAMGFRLDRSQDPEQEPVMLHSEHGSGITVWLTADGGYATHTPEAAA